MYNRYNCFINIIQLRCCIMQCIIFIKDNILFWDFNLFYSSNLFYSTGSETHRSFSRSLFSVFHRSLKSEENSYHTEKNVFGDTSFSSPLGFTEKNALRSRKLQNIQKTNKQTKNHYKITSGVKPDATFLTWWLYETLWEFNWRNKRLYEL